MRDAGRGKGTLIALCALFAAAVAAVCSWRTWLMLARTEHVSGFYTEGSAFAVAGFFVLLAVCLAALAVVSIADRRLRREELTLSGRHLPLAFAFLAAGAGLLPEALKSLRGEYPRSIMIVENEATVQLMSKIEGALGVAACVYFLFAFIAFCLQNDLLKKLRLASLIPVLWAASRALRFLVVTVSIVRVGDLLLEMLGIVAAMLFFLAYARAVTEVGTGSYGAKSVTAALCSALLTLSYAVPRCVLTIFGGGEALTQGYPFRVYELLVPACAVVFALTLLTRGERIDRDPDEPALREEAEPGDEYEASEEPEEPEAGTAAAEDEA